MSGRTRQGVFGLLVVFSALMMTVGHASAVAVTADCTVGSSTCFRPNIVITGPTPSDPFPWLTAEVKQVGSDIYLAMQTDFANASKIGDVWLNVKNDAWLPSLTFSDFQVNSGDTELKNPVVKNANNESPTPGEAGQFDIKIEFKTSSSKAFDGTDAVQFKLTCTGCVGFGLDAFDALSTPGGNQGQFRIAAHVQPSEGDSTKIGGQAVPESVPEPGTLILLGVGLAGLGAVKLRRSRR